MRFSGRLARASIRAAMVASIIAAATVNTIADGWKVQLQGVKALGVSFAGRSVNLDDATTVWFNPAGLTRLTKRWVITTAAPVITYSLDYTDRASASAIGQPLSGPSTVNGGTTSAVPHFYVARKLKDDVSFGFGVNFPFGLSSDYDETWVGRYHATRSELTVMNLNPAFAIKAGDRLSLGFGLDVQYSDAQLANMIDFGSLGAAIGFPFTPQGLDGKIDVQGTDWAVGYDLSVAWDPTARTRVGATFRSRVDHTLAGTADFTVPAQAQVITGGVAFTDTGASTVLPMPAELSVSASQEIGKKWVLVGDMTWTDWSRFQRLTVTFENPAQSPIAQDANYTDSFRSAVGVVYRANDRWELRSGGLHETTPVPDATRNPRLPEGNHTGFSAGASYRFGERGDLDFAVAHLIPHDAPINLFDPAAGQLTGKVRWKLDILAVSLTLRF